MCSNQSCGSGGKKFGTEALLNIFSSHKSKISWKMQQDFREEVEEKPKIRNFMDATLRFRCFCAENCEDKLLAGKNKSVRTVLQGRENKKKRLLCRNREMIKDSLHT